MGGLRAELEEGVAEGGAEEVELEIEPVTEDEVSVSSVGLLPAGGMAAADVVVVAEIDSVCFFGSVEAAVATGKAGV